MLVFSRRGSNQFQSYMVRNPENMFCHVFFVRCIATLGNKFFNEISFADKTKSDSDSNSNVLLLVLSSIYCLAKVFSQIFWDGEIGKAIKI